MRHKSGNTLNIYYGQYYVNYFTMHSRCAILSFSKEHYFVSLSVFPYRAHYPEYRCVGDCGDGPAGERSPVQNEKAA